MSPDLCFCLREGQLSQRHCRSGKDNAYPLLRVCRSCTLRFPCFPYLDRFLFVCLFSLSLPLPLPLPLPPYHLAPVIAHGCHHRREGRRVILEGPCTLPGFLLQRSPDNVGALHPDTHARLHVSTGLPALSPTHSCSLYFLYPIRGVWETSPSTFLVTMTDATARDAYTAYGVDLIRTAGLLLRTTPSTIYRASILLQRFEASVETQFRSQYISTLDMPAYRNCLNEDLKRAQLELLAASSPSSSPPMTEKTGDAPSKNAYPAGVEYLVPNHVQLKMRTGLVPLVDLHAPLDYCIHHLSDHEDIMYLVAACLLISTKMEDPSTRIRAVVNVCMRLSLRRSGTPVNEQSKPSPPRYEDFKACVVEAEEVVLHQLGFQTFVESPYKYVLLYLNILLEPAGDDAQTGVSTVSGESNAGANGTARSSGAAIAKLGRPPVALTQWMIRAVQVVNDLPRCRRLLAVPADALAIYAIQQSCPPDITLPDKWSTVFGVSERLLKAISYRYSVYSNSSAGNRSATAALADARALSTVPLYRTVAERDQYNLAIEQLKVARETAAEASIKTSLSVSPTPPPQPSSCAATGPLPTSFANPASIEELRDLIGASLPSEALHDGSRRRSRQDDDENILVRKSKHEKRHHRRHDDDGELRRRRHHRK
ncbi:hypothetical protein, conserved [Leishmania tarentolae]|uniref:Cyclin N-terminal domain-containing protein n=1 Tax=Leishmania tarentolae TaxID=5689 RepID=A0A640KVU5_LEITA|nr:hypothetical protein, conserved [Leishmania tarentolae]